MSSFISNDRCGFLISFQIPTIGVFLILNHSCVQDAIKFNIFFVFLCHKKDKFHLAVRQLIKIWDFFCYSFEFFKPFVFYIYHILLNNEFHPRVCYMCYIIVHFLDEAWVFFFFLPLSVNCDQIV